LLAGAAAAAGLLALGREARGEDPEGAPVAVATWRHGVAAVTACGAVLAGGGTALDAVQRGATVVELDPEVASVGYGGLPNRDGVVELDACIMDGCTRDAGAVASLQGCRTPTAVARLVMEHTPHVLLVGAGARRFADERGFPQEELLTESSRERWQRWRREQGSSPPAEEHDTVGVLARDAAGHLAAACSTSGLAWKLPGRVGDSPLVGHGLYAEDSVGAAAATGVGEEAIKVCGSFLVVERMRAGDSPAAACQEALRRVRARHGGDAGVQLAFIALRGDGAWGAASLRRGFSHGLWTPAGVQHHPVEPLGS
jgi:N4-(beta-N-acetylglucosaminyl)-L-asparaginase